MEINGLPLHPLVVHAAVVFAPLAALTALAQVLVPPWRDRLRRPMLAAAVLATAFVWAAFLTGESFRDSADFFSQGALGDKIEHHEELASKLRLVTSGFGVVALLSAWLHTRTGAVRVLLGALLAAGSLGVLVLTVLTGDAGAQAVYGS